MHAPRHALPNSLLVCARVVLLVAIPLASAHALDRPQQHPSPEPPPPEQAETPPISTKPAGDPADDSELNDESVEQVRDALRERGQSRIIYPTPATRVSPASPGASANAAIDAGLPSIDPDGPRPQLLPEGSFIVRRRGVLLATDWGAYLFSFAPAADGNRQRPVAILPCETLRRMESAAGALGDQTLPDRSRVRVVGSFLLSGQVTAYQGRNYVLPTAFALSEDLSPPPPTPAPTQNAPTATAPSQDATPPDRPADVDPEISDLIDDLESLRSTPRGTPTSRPSTPLTDSTPPIADDTLIPRRKARFLRTSRGEAAFVFDIGISGSTDAPMILLPCAATEGIERAAARAGDSAVFDISGRAFQHQGRNYFLPLMYVAETSRNVKPLH